MRVKVGSMAIEIIETVTTKNIYLWLTLFKKPVDVTLSRWKNA